MIFDTVSNLSRYLGLFKNLDHAIQYIERTDLRKLSVGNHVIDGNDLFVNIVHSETGLVEEKSYEVHNKYIDLHLVLDGQEDFFCDITC